MGYICLDTSVSDRGNVQYLACPLSPPQQEHQGFAELANQLQGVATLR